MFLFRRGERSCHDEEVWPGRQWPIESFLKRKTGADQQPNYKGNDCMIANQLISERM
jgi:hypothetical protein